MQSREDKVRNELEEINQLISDSKNPDSFNWGVELLDKFLMKPENLDVITNKKNTELQKMVRNINTEIIYRYTESISAYLADFFVKSKFKPDVTDLGALPNYIGTYVTNDLFNHKDDLTTLSLALNRWLSIANVFYEQNNYFAAQAVFVNFKQIIVEKLYNDSSIYGSLSDNAQTILNKLDKLFGNPQGSLQINLHNKLNMEKGDKIPTSAYITGTIITYVEENYKTLKSNTSTEIARLRWSKNGFSDVLDEEDKKYLSRVVNENFIHDIRKILLSDTVKVDWQKVTDLSTFQKWLNENKGNLSNRDSIEVINQLLGEANKKVDMINLSDKLSTSDKDAFQIDVIKHANNHLESACDQYQINFIDLDDVLRYANHELKTRNFIPIHLKKHITIQKEKEDYDALPQIVEEIFVSGKVIKNLKEIDKINAKIADLGEQKDAWFEKKFELEKEIKLLKEKIASSDVNIQAEKDKSQIEGKGNHKEKGKDEENYSINSPSDSIEENQSKLDRLNQEIIKYNEAIKNASNTIKNLNENIDHVNNELINNFESGNEKRIRSINSESKNKNPMKIVIKEKEKKFSKLNQCDIWEVNPNKLIELKNKFTESPEQKDRMARRRRANEILTTARDRDQSRKNRAADKPMLTRAAALQKRQTANRSAQVTNTNSSPSTTNADTPQATTSTTALSETTSTTSITPTISTTTPNSSSTTSNTTSLSNAIEPSKNTQSIMNSLNSNNQGPSKQEKEKKKIEKKEGIKQVINEETKEEYSKKRVHQREKRQNVMSLFSNPNPTDGNMPKQEDNDPTHSSKNGKGPGSM